jgi:Luciferase-like monooxygenase
MKTGLALRSTVFGAELLRTLIPTAEKAGFDSVWFPSVRSSFDTLDMCGISLGNSKSAKVGSGVLRFDEFEIRTLISRVYTLEEGSDGRFILGIGTGHNTGQNAIDMILDTVTRFRAGYPGTKQPLIFLAALKKRMLSAALEKADGAILNFCPPNYIQKINLLEEGREDFTLACYIKLFFAMESEYAKKMMVDELKTYNAIPQYRAMFEEAGVAGEIDKLTPRSEITSRLASICRANPTDDDIVQFLMQFKHAGVDLPIIYPYVSGDIGYKVSVVERLASLVS